METKSSSKHTEPKQRRKVVFVDPDDSEVPYWWPALVVPRKEIDAFKEKVDYFTKYPGEREKLVCYFEDGSYSIVPEEALLPFDTSIPPFTTYVQGPNSDLFLRDKAVMDAIAYFDNGVVPQVFKWLRAADEAEHSGNGNGTNEDHNNERISTGAKKRKESSAGLSKKDKDGFGNGKTHGSSNVSLNIDGNVGSVGSDISNKREGGLNRRESFSGNTKNGASGLNKKPAQSSTSASRLSKPRPKANHSTTPRQLPYLNSSSNIASATLKSPPFPPQLNNGTHFHSLPSPGSIFFPNSPRSDRMISGRGFGTCEQCGRTSDGEIRQQCGACTDFFEWVMSAAAGEMTVNECFAEYVERKRRPVELVGESVLSEVLPTGKRRRWLERCGL
ncbi:10149_t:CDS:2 [Paraglomus occultum]|uniref:10149_t:CDS:1 n=1 Tax=Paraglomus occultum TaxID=144539 RepID=A0A9N9AJW9_9GLOM|nr:10149_t:CDS:2 [Paraglomus occultum]